MKLAGGGALHPILLQCRVPKTIEGKRPVAVGFFSFPLNPVPTLGIGFRGGGVIALDLTQLIILGVVMDILICMGVSAPPQAEIFDGFGVVLRKTSRF